MRNVLLNLLIQSPPETGIILIHVRIVFYVRDIVQGGLAGKNVKGDRICDAVQQSTHRTKVPIHRTAIKYSSRRVKVIEGVFSCPLIP